MRFRFISCFALCLLRLGSVSAQTAATPQEPAPTVFKTTARQIVVDVVVTRSNGEALTGLKQSDFTILEDGKPQALTFFEEHTGAPPANAAPLQLPPSTYSNYPLQQVTDSVNVLLLDALNTPMRDQAYVHQQMRRYLKELPPGTRIAIFTLASRLRMVQDFTTDSSVLLSLLDKNSKALPSPLLNADTGLQTDALQDNLPENNPAAAQALAAMKQFDADEKTFQTDLRVQLTLNALSQIGRYLSGVPGRKNLIWFSGSFPLSIGPDLDLKDPFMAMANYADQVRQTTDLLRESKVAVYPIDARGLMVSPVNTAADNTNYNIKNPNASNSVSAANRKFMQQTATEHQTMDMIAEETGGEAIYNTNGLKDALARVVNNGTHYYSLAYVPANPKSDGSYRHIKVQLAQKGGKLEYRHGYYATDHDTPQKMGIASADPFIAFLTHGLPAFTQMIYDMRVLPENPQPAPGVLPAGEVKNLKGPVTRYEVGYAVLTKSVAFTETPDGVHHGALRFATVLFDQEGKALNSLEQQVQLNLNPDVFSRLINRGMQYRQEIDVPNGVSFLRTGVYDPNTGHVGTLEIPFSKPAVKQ